MKKRIQKTTAGLMAALTALTAGVCTTTEIAKAAEANTEPVAADTATIHIVSYNSGWYSSPHAGKTTQRDYVTARVGDVLEISVYAQANDPEHPLFCCNQTTVTFNNSGEGISRTDNNGMMSFYEDYYEPGTRCIMKLTPFKDVMSIGNPTFDEDFTPEVEGRNHVLFNCSGITTYMDFTDRTLLFSFTVKVEKAGSCYVNTMNHTTTSIHEDDDSFWDYFGADLYTEIKTVDRQEDQTLYGDVNGNGTVNIQDATLLQRHLAEFCKLDDEWLKRADFDRNGKVNVRDVTEIQRYLIYIF